MKDKETPDDSVIGKEELVYILDRTISFIRNCDNKAAVLLGIVGVILTIVFSTNIIVSFKCIFIKCFEKANVCNGYGALLFAFIVSIISIIYGVYNIYVIMTVKLDTPKKIKKSSDSLIFFEDIAKCSDVGYKNKIALMTNKQYTDDIVLQIWINSHICSNKYAAYKKSLRCLFAGSLGCLMMYLIGVMTF